MKYFLFGQVGAGKTFVGRIVAREFGIPFHDADDDLSDAIREAVRWHQPFTPSMRAEVGRTLEYRLRELSGRCATFCIGQALFRNEQRSLLRKAFPDLKWIWVKASAERIEERLSRRTDGLADLAFALANNPYFEEPDFSHETIVNDAGSSAVLNQFAAIRAGATQSVGERVT